MPVSSRPRSTIPRPGANRPRAAHSRRDAGRLPRLHRPRLVRWGRPQVHDVVQPADAQRDRGGAVARERDEGPCPVRSVLGVVDRGDDSVPGHEHPRKDGPSASAGLAGGTGTSREPGSLRGPERRHGKNLTTGGRRSPGSSGPASQPATWSGGQALIHFVGTMG